jgi:UDP-galactopyranose mutase
MKYDYLIVGAGLFGSVFGREATDAGRRVLIIDKRPHIGGNVYTRHFGDVNVHVYGPHIFHTNSERTWQYVNRFAEFNHYVHRPKVRFDGQVYSFPINLMTLQQLWNVRTPAEAQQRLIEERIPCEHPRNLEEWILSQVGEQIYRTFVHGYTMKQWNRDPRALPASIIKRLPIRLNFDDNYFQDRFQGIPIGGYTPMTEHLLDGIDVELDTSFEQLGDWRRHADRLVFTGTIDEFFDHHHGTLEFRSLDFRHEIHQGDFQGTAQVNYTDPNVPYTRIVEHKHFEFGQQEKTVITYEYPAELDHTRIPYYPINDDRNNAIYRRYKQDAARLDDVIFGGRLAEYGYHDMHQVIASALAAADTHLRDAPAARRRAPVLT